MKKRLQHLFQYWVCDTAIGLLKMTIHHGLRFLPIDRGSAFGALISPIASRQYAASDRRARRAWQILRSEEADPASVDAAMRRLWRSVGRTMTEFSVLDRLWDAGRIEVTGVEHLDAVRDADKPRLVVGLHLGNWETIPVALIRSGHPGSGIYLTLDNRFETRIAVKSRERYGAILFAGEGPEAMRAAIKALTLKEGIFIIFIDEFIRGRVFAPAFGRQLKPEGNIAYVARLAAMTGAEIIPAYCERLGDRAQFKVTFLPPVPLVRGRSDAYLMSNVAAINNVIEPIVREHLDQWFYVLDFEFDN